MAKYRPWAGARIWPKYGYLGHIRGRPISGDIGYLPVYGPVQGIYRGYRPYTGYRPIYRCTGLYPGYERSWPGPELYIAYLPATRHAITQVQAGIGQGCSGPIPAMQAIPLYRLCRLYTGYVGCIQGTGPYTGVQAVYRYTLYTA